MQRNEENNRMGKTRDIFKRIRDTKGIFHAKMGTINDRNGMNLTEAKDIKKRWQEYTKELYRKDLHGPDNQDDVVTHLEPDILECEVKRALGGITTNKLSGGDGIPVELFQTWKMMPWKYCTQYTSKFGKLSSGHGTGKVSFLSNPKRRQCSNYSTIAPISHTSKVMLKVLQARL